MAIAAEFGTDGVVEFNRPLVVKKTTRHAPEAVSFIGFGVIENEFFGSLLFVTCLTEDGYPIDLPLDLFSFTDRLRVLRRAVRYVEKIVRDK